MENIGHYNRKFLQITVLLIAVLFIVSGCSSNVEGDDAQRISGTAYSRNGDGAPVNWHKDVKHAFELDEDGILKISYSGEGAGNGHTTTLDLSPVPSVSYENIGLFISEEKTAVAYGGAVKSDPVTIATSNDKGQTWQQTAIGYAGTVAGAKHISFATADAGWLIISEPYDTEKLYHHVYTTADGGKHWNKIESNLYMRFKGPLTGIGSMNESVSVVGLSSKTPFEAGASFTNDGGKKWFRLFITVPDQYIQYTKTTLPPISEGDTLVMPLVLTNEKGDTHTFYMKSKNLGESWQNEENRKIRMDVDVNEYCDT
ncbi:MAG: hypothetical protein PHW03_04105 [Eubacteriales bacterium]|nr:hypothetical protein [Eubacteriales bacterium]